jgi:DNA polymerase-1
VNFGILYGMSASRLAREQKLSYGEAKAFIARYFERFPAIERWKEQTLEEARERGFTRTIMGRVRKLPDLNSRSRMARNAAERVAVNTPIQGSAADIIKVAMVQLAARLEAEMPDVKLLLQVHDELVLEVPDGQVEAAKALLKGVMESAVALDVPLDVEVGVGSDWLAAH